MANIITYTKNLAKSIAYSTVDNLKDRAPATASFVETNQELFKDVYSSVKNYRSTIKRVGGVIQGSKVYEAADVGLHAILEDIKTGEFYNKKRIDEMENRALGNLADMGDTNWDIDLNDNETNSSSAFDSFDDADTENILKGLDESSLANATAISTTVAKTGQYTAEVSKANTRLLYIQQERAANIMQTGFENTNKLLNHHGENLGNMMETFTNNSAKFFETANTQLADQTAILKQILENQKTQMAMTTIQETKTGRLYYEDVVDSKGMVNIREYAKAVKRNAKAISSSMGGDMLFGDMFEGGNQLLAAVSSPLKFFTDQFAKTIMPKMITKSVESLDKTLSDAFSGLMAKMINAQNGEGGFAQTLGKLFGVKAKPTESINLKDYNRGNMPWNGIAQKTLVEVIPGHLRTIEAAITGLGERLYDYSEGTWTNRKDLDTRRKGISEREYKQAYADVMNEMREYIDKSMVKSKADSARMEKEMNAMLRTIVETYNGNPGKALKSDNYRDFGVSSSDDMRLYMKAFERTARGSRTSLSGNAFAAKSNISRKTAELLKDNPAILALFNMSNGFDKGFNWDADGKRITKPAESALTHDISKITDKNGYTVFNYMEKILKELIYFRKNNYGGRGGGSSNGSSNIDTNEELKFDLNQIETQSQKDARQKINRDARNREISESRRRYAKEHILPVYNSSDNRSSLLAMNRIDEAARRKHGTGRYDVDLYSDDYRDYYNANKSYINSSLDEKRKRGATADNRKLIDRLLAAETIGDKMKVVTTSFDDILNAPQRFFTNIINKADERLYNLIWGDGEKHMVNGKPVKGFMNEMVYQIQNTFTRVNDWLDEKILKPIKEKLGIDKFSDIGKKLFEKITGKSYNETRDKFVDWIWRGENSIGKRTKDQLKKDMHGVKEYAKSGFEEAYQMVGGDTPEERKEKNYNKKRAKILGEHGSIADFDEYGNELSNLKTTRKAGGKKDGKAFATNRHEINRTTYNKIMTKLCHDNNTEYKDLSLDERDIYNEKVIKIYNGLIARDNAEFEAAKKELMTKYHMTEAEAANPEKAKIKFDMYNQSETADEFEDKRTAHNTTHSNAATANSKMAKRAAAYSDKIFGGTQSTIDINAIKKMDKNSPEYAEYIYNLFRSLPGTQRAILGQKGQVIKDKTTGAIIGMNGKEKDLYKALEDVNALISSNNKNIHSQGNIDKFFAHASKTASKLGIDISGITDPNELIKTLTEAAAREEDLNISANARGARYITKTGLTTIHEGEMVVPSEMNPFNPNRGRVSKQQEIANENRVKNKFINGLKKNIGSHARGTTSYGMGSDTSATASIRDAMKDNLSPEFQEGLKKAKDAINKNAPAAISGGLIGGGAGIISSLVFGVAGGPLIGAAIGAAHNLAKSSETVNKFLFGTFDEDGKQTKTGLISEDTHKAMQKYLPDMGKLGIVGGALGMLTPFGIAGGAILGSAVGWAKNNSEMQGFLFGEDGLFKPESREKMKKALPKVGIGAVVGAGAGLILGGPFGLLGNTLLGAAGGLATTTSKFQELVLGKEVTEQEEYEEEDPNNPGKMITKTRTVTTRKGGVAGALRKVTVEPLKHGIQAMTDTAKNFMKDKILEPLKNFAKPFTQMIKNGINGIKDGIVNKMNNFFEKNLGVPMKEWMEDHILHPLKNVVKGIFGWPFKLAGKVISAPFKMLGHIGNSIRAKQIKKGTAYDMTAAERLNFRGNHKLLTKFGIVRRDKTEDMDTYLNNSNINTLKSMSTKIHAITGNGDDRAKAIYDIQTSLAALVNEKFDDKQHGIAFSKSNKNNRQYILEQLKAGEWDNAFKAISKLKGRDGKPLDKEEVKNLINSITPYQEDINELKALKDNDKGALGALKNRLYEKTGIKFSNNIFGTRMLNRFTGLMDSEVAKRSYTGGSDNGTTGDATIDAATGKITDTLESNNQELLEALDDILRTIKPGYGKEPDSDKDTPAGTRAKVRLRSYEKVNEGLRASGENAIAENDKYHDKINAKFKYRRIDIKNARDKITIDLKVAFDKVRNKVDIDPEIPDEFAAGKYGPYGQKLADRLEAFGRRFGLTKAIATRIGNITKSPLSNDKWKNIEHVIKLPLKHINNRWSMLDVKEFDILAEGWHDNKNRQEIFEKADGNLSPSMVKNTDDGKVPQERVKPKRVLRGLSAEGSGLAAVSAGELIIPGYAKGRYMDKAKEKFDKLSKEEQDKYLANIRERRTRFDLSGEELEIAGRMENAGWYKRKRLSKWLRKYATQSDDKDRIVGESGEDAALYINAKMEKSIRKMSKLMEYNVDGDGNTLRKLVGKDGRVYVDRQDPKNKRALIEAKVDNMSHKALDAIKDRMYKIGNWFTGTDSKTGASKLQNIASKIWSVLKVVGAGLLTAGGIGGILKLIAPNTQEAISNWWDTKAKPTIGNWWDTKAQPFFSNTLIPKIQELGVAAATGIGNTLGNVGTYIASHMGDIGNWLGSTFVQTVPYLAQLVGGVVSGTYTAASEFFHKDGTYGQAPLGMYMAESAGRRILAGESFTGLKNFGEWLTSRRTITGKIVGGITGTAAKGAAAVGNGASSVSNWVRESLGGVSGRAGKLAETAASAPTSTIRAFVNGSYSTAQAAKTGSDIIGNTIGSGSKAITYLSDATGSNIIALGKASTVGMDTLAKDATAVIDTSTGKTLRNTLTNAITDTTADTVGKLALKNSDEAIDAIIKTTSKSKIASAIASKLATWSRNFIKTANKFVGNSGKEVVEKAVKKAVSETCIDKLISAAAKKAAGVTARLSATIGSLGVADIIFAVADFVKPLFNDANAADILGITTDVLTFPMKLFAGFLNCFMGLPFVGYGLIPADVVVDILWDYIFPMLNMQDLGFIGDITKARSITENTLAAYNNVMGTNYDADQYNYMVNNKLRFDVDTVTGALVNGFDESEKNKTNADLEAAHGKWDYTINDDGTVTVNTPGAETSTTVSADTATTTAQLTQTENSSTIVTILDKILMFLTGSNNDQLNEAALKNGTPYTNSSLGTTIGSSGNGSGRYGQGGKETGRFSQYDKDIQMRYNSGNDTRYQDMSSSGCGPVAATNIVNRYIKYGQGGFKDPTETAKYMLSNGYKETNGGTTLNGITSYLGKNGVNSRITSNKDDIKKAISSGHQVMLMGRDPDYGSGSSPYGPNMHYVTALGTKGKKVYVDDPESKNSADVYDLNTTLRNTSKAIITSGNGSARYGMGSSDTDIAKLKNSIFTSLAEDEKTYSSDIDLGQYENYNAVEELINSRNAKPYSKISTALSNNLGYGYDPDIEANMVNDSLSKLNSKSLGAVKEYLKKYYDTDIISLLRGKDYNTYLSDGETLIYKYGGLANGVTSGKFIDGNALNGSVVLSRENDEDATNARNAINNILQYTTRITRINTAKKAYDRAIKIVKEKVQDFSSDNIESSDVQAALKHALPSTTYINESNSPYGIMSSFWAPGKQNLALDEFDSYPYIGNRRVLEDYDYGPIEDTIAQGEISSYIKNTIIPSLGNINITPKQTTNYPEFITPGMMYAYARGINNSIVNNLSKITGTGEFSPRPKFNHESMDAMSKYIKNLKGFTDGSYSPSWDYFLKKYDSSSMEEATTDASKVLASAYNIWAKDAHNIEDFYSDIINGISEDRDDTKDFIDTHVTEAFYGNSVDTAKTPAYNDVYHALFDTVKSLGWAAAMSPGVMKYFMVAPYIKESPYFNSNEVDDGLHTFTKNDRTFLKDFVDKVKTDYRHVTTDGTVLNIDEFDSSLVKTLDYLKAMGTGAFATGTSAPKTWKTVNGNQAYVEGDREYYNKTITDLIRDMNTSLVDRNSSDYNKSQVVSGEEGYSYNTLAGKTFHDLSSKTKTAIILKALKGFTSTGSDPDSIRYNLSQFGIVPNNIFEALFMNKMETENNSDGDDVLTRMAEYVSSKYTSAADSEMYANANRVYGYLDQDSKNRIEAATVGASGIDNITSIMRKMNIGAGSEKEEKYLSNSLASAISAYNSKYQVNINKNFVNAKLAYEIDPSEYSNIQTKIALFDAQTNGLAKNEISKSLYSSLDSFNKKHRTKLTISDFTNSIIGSSVADVLKSHPEAIAYASPFYGKVTQLQYSDAIEKYNAGDTSLLMKLLPGISKMANSGASDTPTDNGTPLMQNEIDLSALQEQLVSEGYSIDINTIFEDLTSFTKIPRLEIVNFINKYSSSPLKGHEDQIISCADKYKVNPRFIIAIMATEGSMATSENHYKKANYFSLMKSSTTDDASGATMIDFTSGNGPTINETQDWAVDKYNSSSGINKAIDNCFRWFSEVEFNNRGQKTIFSMRYGGYVFCGTSNWIHDILAFMSVFTPNGDGMIKHISPTSAEKNNYSKIEGSSFNIDVPKTNTITNLYDKFMAIIKGMWGNNPIWDFLFGSGDSTVSDSTSELFSSYVPSGSTPATDYFINTLTESMKDGVSATQTVGFNERYLVGSKNYPEGIIHKGLDFGTSQQNPYVPTPVDGIVQSVKNGLERTAGDNWENVPSTDAAGNNVVVKDRAGKLHKFFHLLKNSIPVQVGDSLIRGTVIGKVGSSGMSTSEHLHYQINDGETKLDPNAYLQGLNTSADGTLTTEEELKQKALDIINRYNQLEATGFPSGVMQTEMAKAVDAAKSAYKYATGKDLDANYGTTGEGSGRFGESRGRYGLHTGIDYGAKRGTKIKTPMSGVVDKLVRSKSGLGNSVQMMDRNGKMHLFGHMDKIKNGLKVGDYLRSGEGLGTVGSTGVSTGNHLHYGVGSVNKNTNKIEDWINPDDYLSAEMAVLDNQSGEGSKRTVDSLPEMTASEKMMLKHALEEKQGIGGSDTSGVHPSINPAEAERIIAEHEKPYSSNKRSGQGSGNTDKDQIAYLSEIAKTLKSIDSKSSAQVRLVASILEAVSRGELAADSEVVKNALRFANSSNDSTDSAEYLTKATNTIATF